MKGWLLIAFLLLPFVTLAQKEVDVFFIGNLSRGDTSIQSSLINLKKQTEKAGKEDWLIFLGDNFYSAARGTTPPQNDPQLDAIRSFPGKVVVLSGDQDWDRGGRKGYEQVLAQEEYFRSALDSQEVYFPKAGCAGPLSFPLGNKHILIILNTQYHLHPWKKPDDHQGCDPPNTESSSEKLEAIIRPNKSKRILIVGHHPVLSYGRHSRGMGVQRLTSARYNAFRKQLANLMEISDQLTYLSAHDDGMQYLKTHANHFIIAGAGSDFGRLDSGEFTQFSASIPAFGKIQFAPKATSLTFWNGLNNEIEHQQRLYIPNVVVDPNEIANRPNYSGKTMHLAPDTNLASTGTAGERIFLGNIYRSEWSTALDFPVFDLQKEHGGLKIVKKGGGGQTRSIRLEASDGRQYVLRSIRKWPINAVPAMFKETFAARLATDQMSDSHPYGALVVPVLADAVKIYHTNPQIVALPDDPLFGQYRKEFKGLLALYEERPNDEAAHEKHFGKGVDVKSTYDVLDKLRKDNKNSIDDKFVIRNRLFDMWMGDWDRHEDQWRWVAKKNKHGGGYEFRPIPRDRDQVFFDTDGLLPWLVSRKSVYPIFQGFDHEVKWPDALSWQARWFDRSFLSGLDWNDWEKQIEYLQKHLTDEVIDSAFAVWNDTIFQMSGEEIVSKLHSRRNGMKKYGREYYEFLAREVDITASDDDELFEIKRIDKNKTRVKVYRLTKKGKSKHPLYKRTFLTKETKEIRLYGFGGDDIFTIEGEVKRGIKIRIIGGQGNDTIMDNSRVNGWGKKTVVYDEYKDTHLEQTGETANRLSNNPGINLYDRKAFKIDRTFPLLSVDWNRDDGVFLGGGIFIVKQGFRKYPYKVKHRLTGNLAMATGAFKLHYVGTWTDILGKWDLDADLLLNRPYGVANFFGMGNESNFDTDGHSIPEGFERPIDYYRMRYELFESNINLKYDFSPNFRFYIGPRSGSYHIVFQDDRYVAQPGNGLDSTRTFGYYHYLGAGARFELDSRDSKVLPTRGFAGLISFNAYGGLNGISQAFGKLRAEAEYVFSIRLPAVLSIANRVGYSSAYGGYEFFNGAVLGRASMRGLRRGRFYGDQMFFHNLDLRLKLASFTSIIVPGSFGILGFHDIGRVWYKPESSDRWHNSYGGGIWLSPMEVMTFTLTFAHTDDENQLILKTRFHF